MTAHPVRIYRVMPDITANRLRLLNPDEFFLRYPNAFRYAPMCEHWHALPVPCSLEPKSNSPTNFGYLIPGALTWSRLRDETEMYDVQTDVIEAECEVLPLTVDGDSKRHLAINPRVVNALHRDQSELRRDEYGRVVGIERYAFIPDRLAERIFRVPEGGAWDIFTIYQINEPEDLRFSDLYSACNNLGLTGLSFEPVWEGEYIT